MSLRIPGDEPFVDLLIWAFHLEDTLAGLLSTTSNRTKNLLRGSSFRGHARKAAQVDVLDADPERGDAPGITEFFIGSETMSHGSRPGLHRFPSRLIVERETAQRKSVAAICFSIRWKL